MMSWTDSLIFAATLAVVCSIGIEKIMVMNWDCFRQTAGERK